jgi:hypothetical protein
MTNPQFPILDVCVRIFENVLPSLFRLLLFNSCAFASWRLHEDARLSNSLYSRVIQLYLKRTTPLQNAHVIAPKPLATKTAASALV